MSLSSQSDTLSSIYCSSHIPQRYFHISNFFWMFVEGNKFFILFSSSSLSCSFIFTHPHSHISSILYKFILILILTIILAISFSFPPPPLGPPHFLLSLPPPPVPTPFPYPSRLPPSPHHSSESLPCSYYSPLPLSSSPPLSSYLKHVPTTSPPPSNVPTPSSSPFHVNFFPFSPPFSYGIPEIYLIHELRSWNFSPSLLYLTYVSSYWKHFKYFNFKFS